MNFKKQADILFSKLIKEETEGKPRYFKKREVYPIFNEDGNINWFNFVTGGKWWKLAGIILFVIIVIGFIWEYHSNLIQGAECLSRENLAKNITKSIFKLP